MAQIVLEPLAWNYHELIMAGAGAQAEAMSTQAVQQLKGKYIAVIEGAIPTGANEAYCTIGGRSAAEIAAGGRGQCRRDPGGGRLRLGRRLSYSSAPRRARGSGTSCPVPMS